MSVGQRIKAAREQAGITQAELGEKVGVSGVAIMRYEKGTRQPRLQQLQQIAKALNADVVYLISGQTSAEVEHGILIQAEEEARAELEKLQAESNNRPFDERVSLNSAIIQIFKRLNQFNSVGHKKVVERIEELTEIPRYRRQDPAQPSAEAAPAQDIPAAQDAPEGAEEAE